MGITKKQKDVYDYITSYTEQHGCAPTQREIRDYFGLKSYGSVQRYIKYLTNAGYLSNDWNARRGLKVQSPGTGPETLEVPLLGLVAAGNPIEAIEQADQTLQVPALMIKSNHRYFALEVRGDSMIEDGILEGDYAICRLEKQVSKGQTVVAVIDGEATLKHYVPTPRGLELHPANKHYSPIYVDPNSSQFDIAGVLVGLIRRYE